jgi:hypothetical protein
MENAKVYELNRDRIYASQPALTVSALSSAKPKLLDQVRQAIRTRHYSYMTEKAYVGWIKRFIFFHNKRHPAEMAEAEIAQFLSGLANDSHVSASTQNQALNALSFSLSPGLRKGDWLYRRCCSREKTKQITSRVDPAGG